MVITSGGEVGIGTYTPGYTLDVNGAARVGASSNLGLVMSSTGGDGASFSTVDNTIQSWYGVGFNSTCCGITGNNYSLVIDTRTGNLYTQGSIGVGTASPSSPLTVISTSSAANAYTPSAYFVMNNTATSNSGSAARYASTAQYNKTGSASDTGYQEGAGWFQADVSGGTQTTLDIVDSRGEVPSGGTVTNLTNFKADASYSGGGTISNRYGFVVNDERYAVGNQYGLYINPLTAGQSSNYGIYVAGNTSYFGGNVGIGTTAPNGELDVFNSGDNGDGAVFSPDIDMDNNFTIQTYIDANLGSGAGWAGRDSYASRCCNNLALQPDVGTVSVGGTSNNYGYTFNVNGTANITGTLTAGSFTGTTSAANVSAGTFGSNTGSGYYEFPSYVGIGDTNPTSTLSVNGSVHIEGNAQLITDIDGTSGYFGNFNDPSGSWFGISRPSVVLEEFNPSTDVTAFPSGNVGIGTTSPGATLEVNGNTLVENGDTYQAKNSSGAIENYLWPRWSDNIMYLNYGSNGFNIRNDSSASTMFMTNGGEVGIGTTAPSQLLDIEGGALRINNSGSGAIMRPDNAGVALAVGNGTNSSYGAFDFDNAAGSAALVTIDPSGGIIASGVLEANSANYPIMLGGGSGVLRLQNQADNATVGVLNSSNGWGSIEAENGTFNGTLTAGNLSGAINAANVSAGTFGNNTGGGGYTFPANVTVNGKMESVGDFWTGAGNGIGGGFYDLAAGAIGAADSIYSYGAICTNNNSGACTSTGGVVIGPANTSADVNISNSGTIEVGVGNTTNVQIDSNQVWALNNGAASTLYLNYGGGTVQIGGGSGASLAVDGTVSAPAMSASDYEVNPTAGLGICFWNDCSNYTIAMGNGAYYDYGPVTDYSIRNTMSNTAGRGWTWGANGVNPIAALDISGNMQIAGNLTLAASNPTLYTGGGYLTIPYGLYVSGGTTYINGTLNARGGLNNDNGATLTIGGGTSGYTDVTGKLGIGTTAPDEALEVNGHISTTGSTPTINTGYSCGSGASVTGDDTAGTIYVGSSAGTYCGINFAHAFSKTPVCTISLNTYDNRGSLPVYPLGGGPFADAQFWIYSVSTSGLVVTTENTAQAEGYGAGTGLTGMAFNYTCIGS